MNPNEIRYLVISTLLQVDVPLTFTELVEQCGIAEKEILPVLNELVNENLVVKGELIPDKSAPQYCWGARWTQEVEQRAVTSKRELQTIVSPTEIVPERKLDIDSEPVLKFHNYIINEYQPPKDKRFLVFLQCSVRRPFSSSPSHGSMRRAISVATGYDPSPRKDFKNCPVHVVVLASKIGPVPYELEDIYPANVSGGGVKHFDRSYYAKAKPILAERMTQYIIAHRDNYDRMVTFTESRYGEVMEEARQIAGIDFPVLPVLDGPQIMQIGKSIPRKYWEKYWLQLYLEIVSWLEHSQQKQAESRLRKMEVKYHEGIMRDNWARK